MLHVLFVLTQSIKKMQSIYPRFIGGTWLMSLSAGPPSPEHIIPNTMPPCNCVSTNCLERLSPAEFFMEIPATPCKWTQTIPALAKDFKK